MRPTAPPVPVPGHEPAPDPAPDHDPVPDPSKDPDPETDDDLAQLKFGSAPPGRRALCARIATPSRYP